MSLILLGHPVQMFVYFLLFVCLQFEIIFFSAMFLHNQLLGEPPTIDEKLVAVSYYRPPISKLNSESYK